MRNWPRYSRGSVDADEITRPSRRKIFFSIPFAVSTSVPVFCAKFSHWSRSPGVIVRRLPEIPIVAIRDSTNHRREMPRALDTSVTLMDHEGPKGQPGVARFAQRSAQQSPGGDPVCGDDTMDRHQACRESENG